MACHGNLQDYTVNLPGLGIIFIEQNNYFQQGRLIKNLLQNTKSMSFPVLQTAQFRIKPNFREVYLIEQICNHAHISPKSLVHIAVGSKSAGNLFSCRCTYHSTHRWPPYQWLLIQKAWNTAVPRNIANIKASNWLKLCIGFVLISTPCQASPGFLAYCYQGPKPHSCTFWLQLQPELSPLNTVPLGTVCIVLFVLTKVSFRPVSY